MSFGLITQRSQVQILTPLPFARPDRVLPYPAFFVSPLPNNIPYITSRPDAAAQFRAVARKNVGPLSQPLQAASATMPGQRVALQSTVSGGRGVACNLWCQPHEGKGATRSRRFISAATVQREPGTTLSPAAAVAQSVERGEDIAPSSRVQIPSAAALLFPQKEKGLRANGDLSHSSTPPARKDDYDP
jgi:hypothetical protein